MPPTGEEATMTVEEYTATDRVSKRYPLAIRGAEGHSFHEGHRSPSRTDTTRKMEELEVQVVTGGGRDVD